MKWDSDGISPATHWQSNFALWVKRTAPRIGLDARSKMIHFRRGEAVFADFRFQISDFRLQTMV